MCKCDRVWHIFRCLIRSITKHHSLISGSDRIDLFFGHCMFFCFQRFINTHSNIRRLLIDCCDHTASLCIESEFSSCISDFFDRVTYDLLDINVCIRCDLTHNKYHTCCSCCLACDTAHRILCHQCIQNGIRNLITHFIRMSLCY